MSRPREVQSYHVQWYVDIDGIREDVTVEVGNGQILGIHREKTALAIELGPVALIPGLVNAHTHLEFSSLTEPICTRHRFTDWIRLVVNHRRTQPESVPAAIQTGVAESLRAGTTLIGDIATAGWTSSDYAASGFQGVVFQELLGLTEERVAGQCEVARTIGTNSVPLPDTIQLGLSPHAPYSVHPDLLRAAVHTATQSSRPVAMHLAETQAELELLSEGTGEFREMLSEFGIWREGLFGGRRPMHYLEALAECPRTLIVHGNYLDDSELRFLANHPAMTLVYCPRTHAAFGHPPHPWRRLLELGGSVAIGTDSRASNPDLSLFAELQFVAANEPDISHLELLKAGSHSGRVALTGLSATYAADFCVVDWNSQSAPDPAQNLFAAGNRILATMIAGQWCFRDPAFPLENDLELNPKG